MSGTASATPREIRRAFGQRAVTQLRDQDQAIRVLAEVLTRGFWGRMRWLLTGK